MSGVRVDGAWRDLDRMCARVDGRWVDVQNAYARVDGVWRPFGKSWTDATGGRVVQGTRWRYHEFTVDGTFEVKHAGPAYVLPIGGGGGAAAFWTGYVDADYINKRPGWGGAGGVAGLVGTKVPLLELPTGKYAVKVGAGGKSNPSPDDQGENGGDSSFVGRGINLIAKGGGAGGVYNKQALSGGCGGGEGIKYRQLVDSVDGITVGGKGYGSQGGDGFNAYKVPNYFTWVEGPGGYPVRGDNVNQKRLDLYEVDGFEEAPTLLDYRYLGSAANFPGGGAMDGKQGNGEPGAVLIAYQISDEEAVVADHDDDDAWTPYVSA